MGKANLKVKAPEIQKTIKMVEILREKYAKETAEEKELTTNFLLNDNMWAKAKIPNDTGKVGVWLGANVMVEYSYEDAEKLLTKNLTNANLKMKSTEEDLDFIKEAYEALAKGKKVYYNSWW